MTEPAHKPAERAPAAKGSSAPAHAAEAPTALLEQAPEISAGGKPATRRSAILGDPRLLQRMGADQRARLVRQIQRGQGNGHVARALGRVAQQDAPALVIEQPAAHIEAEAPLASRAADAPTGQDPSVRRWSPLSVIGDVVGSVAKTLLSPIAGLARGLPGYSLLTMILGKDPITEKEVERSPNAIFRALLELVPKGQEIYANLNESGAIDKAFAWLGEQWGQLGLTWAAIKGLFSQAWDKLNKSDLLSPGAAWEKIKGVFADPVGRLLRFGGAVADKVLEFVFEGVLSKLGGGQVLAIIRKIGDTFKQIVKDPIGFLRNLFEGVKLGLMNFVGHIGTHLQRGLTTWLFGELGSAGLRLPEKFDLKGVLSLAAQILGLTFDAIRARAVKMFGAKAVEQLESGAQQGFKLFTIIRDQGLGGIWEMIKEQLGNLKEMAFGALKELISSQIVQAGIQLVVKLLGGPAGAIIQAIQSVYGLVTWFIENASRIATLINAITDAVQAIGRGALDQAAGFVERSLSDMLPMALGFLAKLAGFGGLAQKIKGVIERIQDPVHKAVDWVLDKAKGFAKRLKLDKVASKIKGGFSKIKGGFSKLANKTRGLLGMGKTPKERLEKGLRLGVAGINLLKGRKVTEALIRPGLDKVKKLYGLSMLEPFVKGRFWAVKGDVQREAVQVSTVPGENKDSADANQSIKIHSDFVIGSESHELNNQSGNYTLILSSKPIQLNKHPDKEVQRAYAIYLQDIAAATSPTGKKEAANRNLKLIVQAIKASNASNAPRASAPGIGTIDMHKNQQNKLRRSGIKVWELESEHVIPRSFVDQVFQAIAQAGIPAGKADYNNMHTILLYKGAADKKTKGTGADFSLIREFKDIVRQILKQVFQTNRKGRAEAWDEMVNVILKLLSAFAADAEGRTNSAILAENQENGALRGPEGSPEPPTPKSSQVAAAFDLQRSDINKQLETRITVALAKQADPNDR